MRRLAFGCLLCVHIALLSCAGCSRDGARDNDRAPFAAMVCPTAKVAVYSYRTIKTISVGDTLITCNRYAANGHFEFQGPAKVTLLEGLEIEIGDDVHIADRTYKGPDPAGGDYLLVTIFADGSIETGVSPPWEEGPL